MFPFEKIYLMFKTIDILKALSPKPENKIDESHKGLSYTKVSWLMGSFPSVFPGTKPSDLNPGGFFNPLRASERLAAFLPRFYGTAGRIFPITVTG
jgi:hypothetical protein